MKSRVNLMLSGGVAAMIIGLHPASAAAGATAITENAAAATASASPATKKARKGRHKAAEQAGIDARADQVNSPRTQIVEATGVPGRGQTADIVVTGIRGSVASAAKKKRDAKQISDTVVAEDVGKLPDNNVPEALSHLSGIQIDRSHGEGTGIRIRGLSDVQTTINGNNNAVGEGRSANLADIPAELLKSVTVYKTRTADQVEGGTAGTVNIELRRPLDLPKKLTVAGSVKGVYTSLGKDWSPYGSLLVSDRFETGIGEIGFLLNGSYTRNRYEEDFVETESPGTFFDRDLESLPDDQKGILAPYAMNYGTERGSIRRPSLNGVLQWQPSDKLNFVLEGSYFGSKESRSRDRLHVTVRNGNATLSDVVPNPGGATVRSLTLTSANGLSAGPEAYSEDVRSDNYTTNFEAHWHNDRVQLNASTQYNWSKTAYYGTLQVTRLRGLTTAHVDFDSPNIPGGGPYITFPTASLTDLNSYGLLTFHDERQVSSNHEYAGQVDLTITLSDASLLRSLQSGFRFSDRRTERRYGYRDGLPVDSATGLPLLYAAFPGGSRAELISPNIPGFSSPSWYKIPGSVIRSNLDDIFALLQQNGGNGAFSTRYPSGDRGQEYNSTEKSWAAYAQVNYAFKAGFPVDGVIGARLINTWGDSTSTAFRTTIVKTPTGTDTVSTTVPSSGKGNYIDVLPSANAIIHFTPKLQLRLAYTYNVQRPAFLDLTPFEDVNGAAIPPTVFSGNPDLNASKETSYDTSLEYYFGKAGQLSLAGFIKDQDGAFFYSRSLEFIPSLGTTGYVSKVRNAGKGRVVGVELSGQTFFDFLPGILKKFGASGNITYLPTARVDYGVYGINKTPYLSKYTYNAALYYDTPAFSARVTYNWQGRRAGDVYTDYVSYTPVFDPTKRLDAAINYTPVSFLTLSIEGTNLTKESDRAYFGKDRILPLNLRIVARTVQASARFRF